VFVDGSPAFEIVMRDCHILRLEIPAMPAGQALINIEATHVYEGHSIYSWPFRCRLHSPKKVSAFNSVGIDPKDHGHVFEAFKSEDSPGRAA
jgi:hypothetical protein